jgi:N-acetylmuramic acid 6-phosphate etherase
MQASTVLQLAVGYALLTTYDAPAIEAAIVKMADALWGGLTSALQPFTEREAELYRGGAFVLYAADTCAITVFTDTTERAPTFSLAPMSNDSAPAIDAPSLSYVILPAAPSSEDAWRTLLGRDPRPLEWRDIDSRTTRDYLDAFDFSSGARSHRDRQLRGAQQETSRISGSSLVFDFMGTAYDFGVPDSWHPLERHTLLKMLLNQHSTLVMGRLGRYERNIMTWVTPTNGKLIDRAARYARELLTDRGINASYETVVRELYRQRPRVAADASVVMRVVNALSSAPTT